MRLAKCATGKYEFVGFWGGFHGKTMGSLSHVAPYANCYRCPMTLEPSSYGGNPLASAPAAMGESFLEKLKPMLDDYSFVGDVRGAGLFLGLELVKDKRTKEPLSKTVTNRIFAEFLKRGLLTMAYAASFRIQPAMTIDNAIAILREVSDWVKVEELWRRA